jgi:hypothetical protein
MTTPFAAISTEKRDRPAGKTVGSTPIAACLCLATVVGFAAVSPSCVHWFLLPVACCGVLIGRDAVDWLLGRLGLFDPVGVLGGLGFHFFFLAPLLHVSWDYWTIDHVPTSHWRDWLGAMALLNAFGLVAYRFARDTVIRPEPLRTNRRKWTLDTRKFFPLAGVLLVVAALLQLWVYARHGGISGYIGTATAPDHRDAMRGLGWVFMVSESFPILAMMFFAACATGKPSFRSRRLLAVVLVGFLVLAMLFGGLRGSRSNTIWNLFWAVGIVHVWIRPISKKVVLIGALLGLSFMYFYGFYKNVGLDALDALDNPRVRGQLEDETGRSLGDVLLGDLGRSDVQAFLLHRVTAPKSDYQFAWGRTYLGTAALLIPRSLWPDRPPTKIKEGTEIQYGAGYFVPGMWASSRVYGLAGEAMLNFGPLAVPLAFVVFGCLVAGLRQWMMGLEASDSRLLLAPFLVTICFITLAGDSDNVLFDSIKNFAIPWAVIFFGSTRQEIPAD